MTKTFATKTSTFQATFFPYCTEEWNQLNDDLQKVDSIQHSKNTSFDKEGVEFSKFSQKAGGGVQNFPTRRGVGKIGCSKQEAVSLTLILKKGCKKGGVSNMGGKGLLKIKWARKRLPTMFKN